MVCRWIALVWCWFGGGQGEQKNNMLHIVTCVDLCQHVNCFFCELVSVKCAIQFKPCVSCCWECCFCCHVINDVLPFAPFVAGFLDGLPTGYGDAGLFDWRNNLMFHLNSLAWWLKFQLSVIGCSCWIHPMPSFSFHWFIRDLAQTTGVLVSCCALTCCLPLSPWPTIAQSTSTWTCVLSICCRWAQKGLNGLPIKCGIQLQMGLTLWSRVLIDTCVICFGFGFTCSLLMFQCTCLMLISWAHCHTQGTSAGGTVVRAPWRGERGAQGVTCQELVTVRMPHLFQWLKV